MACSVPTEHIYLSVAPGLDICLTLHIDGRGQGDVAKQRCPLDVSQRTKATGVQLSIKGRGYGGKMEITSIKMQAL